MPSAELQRGAPPPASPQSSCQPGSWLSDSCPQISLLCVPHSCPPSWAPWVRGARGPGAQRAAEGESGPRGPRSLPGCQLPMTTLPCPGRLLSRVQEPQLLAPPGLALLPAAPGCWTQRAAVLPVTHENAGSEGRGWTATPAVPRVLPASLRRRHPAHTWVSRAERSSFPKNQDSWGTQADARVPGPALLLPCPQGPGLEAR